MMNYSKILKNKKGFTLVELMIVVAIIGVLASIAVPQYSKFQAKSRQAEVRIQLGAAYTVEQSFAAENSTYTQCLGSIGYSRDGTKFYYRVGIDSTGQTNCEPGKSSGGSCLAYQWQYVPASTGYSAISLCSAEANVTFFPANIAEPGETIPTTTNAGNVTTNVSNSAFIIGGAGAILKGANNVDTWQIDNNKQILNRQSGLN